MKRDTAGGGGIGGSTDSKAELYMTDGTRAGTQRVATLFEGPVVANGRVIYTSAFDDASLRTTTIDSGIISGTLSRDDSDDYPEDDHAFARVGRPIFLDLDGDGTRDADEPQTQTDDNGTYTFADVKARSKLYAVTVVKFGKWSALDGWSTSLRVHAGKTTTRDFRFADHKHSGVITGSLVSRSGGEPLANREVVLIIDHGAYNSNPIARVMTDAQGRFTFDGLTARTYTLTFGKAKLAKGSSKIDLGVGEVVDLSA